MFDLRPWLAAGVLINSALYFVAVVAAALVQDNHFALYAAIAAIGLTYLSSALNLAVRDRPTPWLVDLARVLSIACIGWGAVAGLLLLL